MVRMLWLTDILVVETWVCRWFHFVDLLFVLDSRWRTEDPRRRLLSEPTLRGEVCSIVDDGLTLWRPLLPYVYGCVKVSCDRPGWASECPDVKNYKWRLNPVGHSILYSCTHMATVGVKGSFLLPCLYICWLGPALSIPRVLFPGLFFSLFRESLMCQWWCCAEQTVLDHVSSCERICRQRRARCVIFSVSLAVNNSLVQDPRPSNNCDRSKEFLYHQSLTHQHRTCVDVLHGISSSNSSLVFMELVYPCLFVYVCLVGLLLLYRVISDTTSLCLSVCVSDCLYVFVCLCRSAATPWSHPRHDVWLWQVRPAALCLPRPGSRWCCCRDNASAPAAADHRPGNELRACEWDVWDVMW